MRLVALIGLAIVIGVAGIGYVCAALVWLVNRARATPVEWSQALETGQFSSYVIFALALVIVGVYYAIVAGIGSFLGIVAIVVISVGVLKALKR